MNDVRADVASGLYPVLALMPRAKWCIDQVATYAYDCNMLDGIGGI